MKKWLLTAICCVLFSLKLSAENLLTDAKSAALGYSGVTFTDVHAGFINPAGLASINSTSILISAQNKYAIAKLSTLGMVTAIPTKFGCISAVISQFGNQAYVEQSFALGFGKKLTDKLSIGIKLNYLDQHIEGYNKVNAIGASIGFLSTVAKNLRAGIVLTNPVRVKTNSIFQEQLKQQITGGFSWQCSKKVSLLLELEGKNSTPYSIKSGLEYHIVDHFIFRFGYQQYPQLLTCGFAYQTSALAVAIGVSQHPILGYSSHLSISYQLPKR